MKFRFNLRSVILLIVMGGFIPSRVWGFGSYYPQPNLSRRQRSLNWAKINNEDKPTSNYRTFQSPSQPLRHKSNRYVQNDSTKLRNQQEYAPTGLIPRGNKPPTKYEYVGTGYGRPQYNIDEIPIVSEADYPSNQLQKRALDLMYHRFVEPRIHKHIEPRPSLIEDLMKTFDNHVRKDIAAWNSASRNPENSHSKSVQSESQTQISVAAPPKVKSKTKPSHHNKPAISSVAHVEEGETDDTFVVTDDAGVTHLITVDEIINSLAQMDENEITELLLGHPPKSDVKRADTLLKPIYQPSSLPSLISEDIQYSRKGADDNDIVLIKSPDGDTRLVTVKDLKAAEQKRNKKLGIFSENLPLNQIKSDSSDIRESAKVNVDVSKQAPFMTIDDILRLQNPQGVTNQQKNEPNSQKGRLNLQVQNEFDVNQPNSNYNSEVGKLDGLASIRESLSQVQQQQLQQKKQQNRKAQPQQQQNRKPQPQQMKRKPQPQQMKRKPQPQQMKRKPQPQQIKRKPQPTKIQQNIYSPPPKIDSSSFSFSLPTAPLHSGASAPNSPPLKVINTDASIMEFLPYKNTVSIAKNEPPVIQKTGIRNRLANFFSRLIRKPRHGTTKPEEEEENQFVQIVMPRSDSNVMEQITIPLPKPIHFNGGYTMPSIEAQERKDKTNTAEKRSSSIFSSFINGNTKHERAPNKHNQNMKVGTSTAELILKTAKIPESVKQNVLSQINNKPEEFVLPSERHTNSKVPEDRSRIDRIFEVVNKGKKKDIEFPTSYVYEIPPPFEYHEPHYYVPHPSHEEEYLKKQKDKKKKNQGDDYKPPLVDVNLLADIVYLSKFGEDNESFAFPKIGDSSRFVDVRRNYYT